MAKHENLTALFTAIADSIRGKTGGTDAIIADDFPEAIDGIQTGGGTDKIQRYIELQGNSAERLFYQFAGTSVDELMAGVDTSNATSTKHMFYHCSKLTSVPLFDTSNVTNMHQMFYNCSRLTSIPLFDTSNVTIMQEIFYGCDTLTSVPLFDTSNVTNMIGMLFGCDNLTSVPLFDTRNVTDMRQIFKSCINLTSVPLFDTSNVTNMMEMFCTCSKLTSIPLFDTSNVTNMQGTFYNCRGLTSIPLFDTRNVTYMKELARMCDALISVPALDARNVNDAAYMFIGCKALTEIWVRNIKTNFQVGSGTSWGHLLTLESLLHLCKECRNAGSSRTLTVGSANLEKLANVYVKLIDVTDEMRAEDDLIDEKSPFVQCESTDEGAMLVSDYMATKMWSLA